MTTPFTLTATCRTDPGKRRRNNQDACLADLHRCCFIVADGMGGAAAGEVASSLFTDTAATSFQRGKNIKQTGQMIEACFQQAHERIHRHVAQNPAHSGMGCTAELLTMSQNSYVLGHVGDSRTYLFRDDRLNQLTKDHSLLQDQVDRGLMTPAQAQQNKLRNIILRAVGSRDQLEVDILHGPTRPGDLFLLCSDGLHNVASPEQICSVLQCETPLPHRAEMLIALANAGGGPDNIGVTLVEVQA